MAMKNLDGEIIGRQERFYDSILHQGRILKSKTVAGSTIGYLFTNIDLNKPIVITE